MFFLANGNFSSFPEKAYHRYDDVLELLSIKKKGFN